MRFVMFAEKHLAFVGVEAFPDVVGHPQTVAQPEREGHQVGAEPLRRTGDVGLEQAIELDQRLFVEPDQIEVAGLDARLAQAVVDGLGREGGVVLAAGETLLLGGGDNTAVLDQAGRRVVVVGGNPEDAGRHVRIRTANR